jgi:hypothetical protein
MSTALVSAMRAGDGAPVLAPSVTTRSMSFPAGLRPASPLARAAIAAAIFALALFSFMNIDAPREIVCVVLLQLAANNRTVRKTSSALAALVTSRGCRCE